MKIKSICGVIAASLNAAPCFAQTSNIDEAFPRGSEARATITIPFGGSKHSQKDKPRLEFGIRQYQNDPRQDWILKSGAAHNFEYRGTDFIESKVGFTLSKEKAFLVNGREMDIHREELGLNTGGKVAIGVGVTAIVVAGVIGFNEFREALGEASD